MKTPAVAALLALGTAALALGGWSFRVRDLDVRSDPRRVSIGAVQPGTVTGEVFTAVRDGLERVDVAVTTFTEQALDEVELVLRADGPEGAELRRVRAARLEPASQGGWLVFEFEPVPDSAGRRFHAAYGPAPGIALCGYGPWIRVRGMADRGSPWGAQTFAGPLVEGRFISDHANLRALAFGGEELGSEAQLVLLDPAGREVRRARAENSEPVEWGWLVFGFEPVVESRWRTWSYRLELQSATTLRGSDDGPARVGFYGGGRVDGHLHGLTRGATHFTDRDLVLRTWSERGPSVGWALLSERLGARGVLAAALFVLAGAALAAGLGAAQRRDVGKGSGP